MEATKTIKGLISKSSEIGDTYYKMATEGQIDAAKIANQAFGNAIKGLQTQLIYNRQMKRKNKIAFLESE